MLSSGQQISEVRHRISGRDISQFKADFSNTRVLDELDVLDKKLGIALHNMPQQKPKFFMDAQTPITTPSILAPYQYLQTLLPGIVEIATRPRKIDEIIGMSLVGSWEDASVIQEVLELDGLAVPYGDATNIPLASYNVNFAIRNVIPFEQGMQVGKMEEARAARIRLDTADSKRRACTMLLEIARNLIGFFGYNAGNNNTYGFLNDPSLSAYQNVPAGASSSTLWSTKTYLEITHDLQLAVASLQTVSQGLIDPMVDATTLAVSNAEVTYLGTPSQYGNSVRDYIKETWPKMRIVAAPELDAANGGANVFYLFADQVNDSSTDDKQAITQNVQTKFMVLGVQQEAKGYKEDYVNATAGVMVKRPYAITRWSGI